VKIDKSLYTKEEFKLIREQRRIAKNQKKRNFFIKPSQNKTHQVAFVLGNGNSRRNIVLEELSNVGVIYGCNALYREFSPEYLVAVDAKMILEINKSGYQNKHEVWTNPNRAYERMNNFNFFQPSKGWSSGPTALWLAVQHKWKEIFILGFDFKGLDNGKKFNNIYANTPNYKKSSDSATFFGNWARQTKTVIKENPDVIFKRVIDKGNYTPEDLEKLDNFQNIDKEFFKKTYSLT